MALTNVHPFPLAAQVNGVLPRVVLVLTSAPPSINNWTASNAFLSHATFNGVAPRSFLKLTLAPLFNKKRILPSWFFEAATYNKELPSSSTAFTSPLRRSNNFSNLSSEPVIALNIFSDFVLDILLYFIQIK